MLYGDRSLMATDERGQPKMPGIHDARLTRLPIDFGRRLSFTAVGAESERTVFVLDDIEMLHIASLWEGVIVDSVAIWPTVEGSNDDLDGDRRRAWSALLAGRVSPEDETGEIARAKRQHDGSTLVSVSCSYGGELHALRRRVLIDGRGVAMIWPADKVGAAATR